MLLSKKRFDFNNEGQEKFIPFTNISDDIEYVLEDADIVQVIIPSSFIEYYAKVMSHFVTDKHLIFST